MCITQAPLLICSAANKVHCVSHWASESSLDIFLPSGLTSLTLSTWAVHTQNSWSTVPLPMAWDLKGQDLVVCLFFEHWVESWGTLQEAVL